MLTYIAWNVNPDIYTFNINGTELPLRWYGVLFAAGFLIAQQILYYIFRKDLKPSGDVDKLTIYIVVGTIIGARLGHYIFYEWELLLQAPGTWFISLITPPFSGLASHGGTMAVLVAIYLYSRQKDDQSFLWVVDRIAVVAPLTGAFIRFGNLMNSEIYGEATSLPWAFIFQRETDPSLLPLEPRHPTQLYEMLVYLLLFAYTFYLWKYKRATIPVGTITAVLLIVLFTARFLIEFLKNNQSGFENELFLNMGQLLSIPAVILGIVILIIGYRRKEVKL
ncbi:prolipoprotein diacylglyceryl transferase [Ohtaekwangia kribbensis]|jgi:phosphatidylglycerol:prolipoprotein diacylglycerol transferase|uniref:Phosphatidylglycerol--prolipoprotein diacylglyceryl transferase n=1 Tax=Ohtaekwangia kribbensis TaxID=688913 RepID=A0ABW3K109_9BACT